ncbi:MAG: PilN domain-containing protein [Gammaproteobacteria bacterium]|nr:PilN domain-containing protein [Gammaproteobacteria bacterium]
MAEINLLPWRDERRAELKQEFLAILGVVVAFAGLMVFVADLFISGQIKFQNDRNSYMKDNIAVLNKQVEEIREMQRKRTQLLDRMTVIQELQGNRPIIVRILDQLVRTVPDGVFYTNVKAREQVITIKGIAESNNRVSSLMRRLDASDWFKDPNLEGVKAEPEFGEQATTFNLTVKLQLPSRGEEEG